MGHYREPARRREAEETRALSCQFRVYHQPLACDVRQRATGMLQGRLVQEGLGGMRLD